MFYISDSESEMMPRNTAYSLKTEKSTEMAHLLQMLFCYVSVVYFFSVFSPHQPSVSSCDALVVPVGQSSMSKAINVIQKLWSTGVSADIAYDVSQVSGLFASPALTV